MGVLFDRLFVNRFMYWLGEKIDNGQWEYVYLGYRRKYETRAQEGWISIHLLRYSAHSIQSVSSVFLSLVPHPHPASERRTVT